MLAELAEQTHRGSVTLVDGAKDPNHNQALVLKEVLERQIREP